MKIWQFIKNPKLIMRHFKLKRLYGKYGRSLSDEEYIKQLYKLRVGKDLNLENPKTFNEKLQWLKLHNRNPEYTKLVDKYEVKKYVADIIGEEHVVPTLGIYDNFDEINFDALPNQFVIKCTHDSGSVMICKDKSKLNVKKAKKYFTNKLAYNYYYNSREWPYKNVKPRIIIEKYIDAFSTGNGLKDFKFMCFSGNIGLIQVNIDRYIDHKQDYYNQNFEKLDIVKELPNSNVILDKPACFEEMVKYTKILAKNYPHVRIDWCVTDTEWYFGEITFFDSSGFEDFNPAKYNDIFGDLIKINL